MAKGFILDEASGKRIAAAVNAYENDPTGNQPRRRRVRPRGGIGGGSLKSKFVWCNPGGRLVAGEWFLGDSGIYTDATVPSGEDQNRYGSIFEVISRNPSTNEITSCIFRFYVPIDGTSDTVTINPSVLADDDVTPAGFVRVSSRTFDVDLGDYVYGTVTLAESFLD